MSCFSVSALTLFPAVTDEMTALTFLIVFAHSTTVEAWSHTLNPQYHWVVWLEVHMERLGGTFEEISLMKCTFHCCGEVVRVDNSTKHSQCNRTIWFPRQYEYILPPWCRCQGRLGTRYTSNDRFERRNSLRLHLHKRKHQHTNKQPNNKNTTGKSRNEKRVRRVSKELANPVIKVKLS